MINYTKNKNSITFLTAFLFSLNIVCMESFLPLSIGNYRIQAPKEHNTIITDLECTCRELLIETLAQVMQPDSVNNNTVAIVGSIHNDLGLNQSLFFMQLIHNLALKTVQDSATILSFINKQRKIYNRKDIDGNVNKTAIFFAAFDDAKKLFYFLFPIQNKILNNESLTEKEHNFLLKNMHLMDWKLDNSGVAVTRPFFKRFHEVVMHHGGYWQSFRLSALHWILLTIDGTPLSDNITKFLFLIATVQTLFQIVPLSVNATYVAPRQITIPSKQDNETVSLEDMDTIIENTPWLE